MRQLPPSRASSGYTPNRLKPLALAPVSDQGQRLTDIQAIQRLFANGENGGYWPADPAFLYEDSAGTIPATLNGVVGILLDQSRGQLPAYRRNLLTKSEDFSVWVRGVYANHIIPTVTTNTDIAPDGSLTADTLTCTHESASTIGNTTPLIAASANQVFTLSCWAKSSNVSQFMLKIAYGTSGYGGANFLGEINSSEKNLTNNWVRYTHTATLPNNVNITSVQANISFSGETIGNTMQVWGAQLELGESATPYQKIITGTADLLPGNHAYQQTTANKPYLRRTPTSQKYWLDSNTASGALTATFASSLGSACTIATVGAEGVTILENQTVGTTYNIAPAWGYRSDVLIINRALTELEKTIIRRIFNSNVPTLGSELITNGEFSSATGWGFGGVSGGASVTIEDGRAHIISPAGVGWTSLSQNILSANIAYVFQADVEIISGTAVFNTGSSDISIGTRLITSTGRYKYTQSRGGDDAIFYLSKYSSAANFEAFF